MKMTLTSEACPSARTIPLDVKSRIVALGQENGLVAALSRGGGCNIDEGESASMPETAAFVLFAVLFLYVLGRQRERLVQHDQVSSITTKRVRLRSQNLEDGTISEQHTLITCTT